MGVCLHVRARTLPLTTPPSASATAPPPPPHTIVGIDACCTQCRGRAVCCEGRLAERAGGRPTGINQLQVRAPRSSTAQPPPLLCAPPSQERQNKQTRHHIIRLRGAGRGAAQHLEAGDAVPECTVHRAATTGGVPANCAAQPALSYASLTRFHINLTVPETGELPATFAADKSNICC